MFPGLCTDLYPSIDERRIWLEQLMKVYFDEKADAVYLRLGEPNITEPEEVQPGIILDFNENNQVVGVEILKVKKRVPLANLKEMKFEVA